MKFFLSLLLGFIFIPSSNAQKKSVSSLEINTLVKQYNKFFLETKVIIDSFQQEPHLLNNSLWNDLLFDKKIYTESSNTNLSDSFKRQSFNDLGLKWVSDATYNFSPGIAENEDVFFRSRISTGIDWVLLGDGSLNKQKQENSLFNKQIRKDSLQNQLQQHSIALQNTHRFVQQVFDLHRLNVLQQYQKILFLQAGYTNNMYNNELVTNAEKVQVNNKLQLVTNSINLYKQYLAESNIEEHVKKYWNLPYTFADLPNVNSISTDSLLKNEETLVQMQKDILISKQKNNEKPSLRTKFRYNYYDNAQQQGRSFASVGASLTVPIRFGKDNQTLNYELALHDNQLYHEKLKLKDELVNQHKQFYLTKTELQQVQGEIDYLQALLDNELSVYTNENKNFSPAKYISYAEEYLKKQLQLLSIKQKLCEDYILFQTLNNSRAYAKR